MRRSAYAWTGLVMLVAACATASLPPSRTLEPGDLKALADRWEGSLQSSQGRRTTWTWVVREDGTFITTGVGAPTDGRMSIQGGQVVVEGAFTDAVLTLHEGDGRRILRGPARVRGGGRESEVEAIQVK